MRVCFTVDMGPDTIADRDTYRGVVEGTPALLTLLGEERVPGTFFVTGEVARRFPNIVRQIADWGHEIGLLGDEHHHFARLPENDVRAELHVAASMVRRFYRAVSYRAAGFESPERYLHLVEMETFFLDASLARFRANYWSTPRKPTGMLRVSVSVSAATLRLPSVFRASLLRMLGSPVVIALNPAEFVERPTHDARTKPHHPLATPGLRSTIRFFKNRASVFVRMEELLPPDDFNVELLDPAEDARSVA